MLYVFLGGTVPFSKRNWREELIPLLEKESIDYFNPVVDDWNEEAKKREEIEKTKATHRLYVLTPDMEGVYSIAEVVDDSNKCPEKTILMILEDKGWRFSKHEMSSLQSVVKMVRNNGATIVNNYQEIIDILKQRRI